MTTTDPGWVVTPKDAPAELAEGYKAPEFIPMAEVIAEYTGLSEERLEDLGGVPETLRTGADWVSIQEKIGAAKMEELLAIFGGYPLLTFTTSPHDEIRLLLKRIFDVVCSLAALIVLVIPMLIVALPVIPPATSVPPLRTHALIASTSAFPRRIPPATTRVV